MLKMNPDKIQPLLHYIKKYVSLTAEEEAFLISKISYRKYLKGQYIHSALLHKHFD